MKQNHDHTLKTYFAHHVRDITPAGLRPSISVLYMPVTKDPDFLQDCRSLLSPCELNDIAGRPTDEDNTQFIVRRAFRRYCASRVLGGDDPLADVQFDHTEVGRPFLAAHPGTSFSFSTCARGYLAAWSSQFSVGVDIENPTRAVEAIDVAEHYFTMDEAAAVRCRTGLDQKTMFFRLWTLKEAALKSIGQGLPFGLDAFSFAVSRNIHITSVPNDYAGTEYFQAHRLQNTDGCASLVIH